MLKIGKRIGDQNKNELIFFLLLIEVHVDNINVMNRI